MIPPDVLARLEQLDCTVPMTEWIPNERWDLQDALPALLTAAKEHADLRQSLDAFIQRLDAGPNPNVVSAMAELLAIQKENASLRPDYSDESREKAHQGNQR